MRAARHVMKFSSLEMAESDRATIEELLREMPESYVVERFSLEARLGEVLKELDRLRLVPRPKPFAVTFRGRPVDGTRAIDAGFAGKALSALIDAVDVVAASLTSDLKASGPLPRPATRGLQVVGTATGSFGFELELPVPAAAHANERQTTLPNVIEDAEPSDPYATAIAKTLKLLEVAKEQDDDAMSDLISEVHPRAAAKIRELAEVLSTHEAGIAAEFEQQKVVLDPAGDARRVADALQKEDINEREDALAGVLLGVFPEARRFECRLSEGNTVIHGRLDRSVIVDELKVWIDKKARLDFRIIKVRTRERYVLRGATVG